MKEPDSLNIVVIFDSAEAICRAREMIAAVSSTFGPACKVNCEYWLFEFLFNNALCWRANAAALGADLVLIAADGRSELTQQVTEWFRSLAPANNQGRCALVALFEEERDSAGVPRALADHLSRWKPGFAPLRNRAA